VAIAGTATAARLLAHGAPGEITVVESGDEADALARLPLELLATLAAPKRNEGGLPATLPPTATDTLAAFKKWGLQTLGDVAALPADAVAARLGQAAVTCQRLARGEDLRPLLPAVPEERFEQALDLEWPIEGLEPLSFVLGRLIEPLAAHLDRRGRGAAVLHVRLHLVTRAVHERALQLPAPMKDARTLPLPSPEQISTLMARLSALMGEGRCGSPVEVDSWQPGASAMKPFAPGIGDRGLGIGNSGPILNPKFQTPDPKPHIPRFAIPDPQSPIVALRRFRIPVPVRVRVEQGRPARVVIDRHGFGGGAVTRCAGPWRTAGNWWSAGTWDRDEWDVTLGDGATYRVFRDRGTDAWFLDGVVD
jgi:protein ImuB